MVIFYFFFGKIQLNKEKSIVDSESAKKCSTIDLRRMHFLVGLPDVIGREEAS